MGLAVCSLWVSSVTAGKTTTYNDVILIITMVNLESIWSSDFMDI